MWSITRVLPSTQEDVQVLDGLETHLPWVLKTKGMPFFVLYIIKKCVSHVRVATHAPRLCVLATFVPRVQTPTRIESLDNQEGIM